MLVGVTTTLKSNGQILIPTKVRREKKLRAGDDFEVLVDEDDPNVILLRRVQKDAQPNWVDVLLACPVQGWLRPMRLRREPMRKVGLRST